MDEARRKGMEVDVRSLARDLGVPAVPTVARTKEGLHDLVRTVSEVIDGAIKTNPQHPRYHPELEKAIDELAPEIEKTIPGIPNARWIAYRLLDGDHRIREALISGELVDLAHAQTAPAQAANPLISLEGRQ
jgi:ferrous iron transport protein B